MIRGDCAFDLPNLAGEMNTLQAQKAIAAALDANKQENDLASLITASLRHL